jgi:ribulose-phosphate 3-epimerase
MNTVRIAPSILSCDFGRLHDEVQAVEEAGADWIHVDVMDGRYVPNLTIGPVIVEAVRKATSLPVDVHLMIVEPDRWIDPFIDAGADGITVHQEACVHLQRALAHIRERGKLPGVSLNPSTSPETLRYVAQDIELALVMSVNPGFGGQKFLASQLQKIRAVRKLLRDQGNDSAIVQVDGGITPDTAGEAYAAGADVLVAGSAVYKKDSYKDAIAAIRKAAEAAA